ncbi:MAG TPA: lamin tail domain-containing protein [Planctomycetota bacterium]|nr:lamin tail domain-containing protein [Planctomycetota bacterium]
MKPRLTLALLAAALAGAPLSAQNVRITEWMYNGAGKEFVEFTNLGASPVDMTGWSYDDDSATPGSQSLSGFGTVAPGESVVFGEDSVANIQAQWSLAPAVKIVGGSTNNLGKDDRIFLFDAAGSIVDELDYGVTNFPGSIATNGTSGIPAGDEFIGANSVLNWISSFAGDGQGSHLSTLGDRGSPGVFVAGSGWNNAVGPGLAGSAGVPQLLGSGLMVTGKTITLALTGGLPAGSAALVIGLGNVSAPFKGGVLVPSPNLLLAGLPLDGAGALALVTAWPAGIPSAVTLYYQDWIADAAAIHGFSSSNGVSGKTP